MNLVPRWVEYLSAAGVDAVHWGSVGDPRATDETIMAWAREHGRVVFTQDLDFTVLLALTRATGPSVLQIRAQDTLPEAVGPLILLAIEAHGDALEAGAIVSVNQIAARVRILPIGPNR